MIRPLEIAPGYERFAALTPTLPPATHTNSYAIGTRDVLLVEPATPYEEERREWLAWAPLLALIVALGVYPNLVFKATDPAVKNVTLQEECLQDYVEADCASVFKPKHAGSESVEAVEEGG